MRLSLNFAAGFTNSAWTAIIGLAVVPFYLKYLGIEAYGLIGFYTMTQSILLILDLGLALTINREVARSSAPEDIQDSRNLLHSLAYIYWATAILIAALIFGLSDLIAGYWLQSNKLPHETLRNAVTLIGIVIACRWPIGLYQGALMGAQRLTISSGISIAMVTLGSGGAVVVLAFITRSIEAFFIWHAIVGLVYLVVVRWAAWSVLGRRNVRFDFPGLKRIFKFTAGMSLIAFTGLVLMQLDKLLLSKLVDLVEFGYYALATVIVSALYMVITPVFNSVYPRMSALVSSGDIEQIKYLYRVGTQFLAALLFPLTMILAVFGLDVIYLWTGNQEVAANVAPLVLLLALGSALHGVMYFPYALQLAYGKTNIPITINLILVIIMIPLVVYLALNYGAMGAASAWAVSQVIYVVLGTWLTNRKIALGISRTWLLRDVGLPLLVVSLLGASSAYVIDIVQQPILVKIIMIVSMAIISCAACVSLSPELRSIVLQKLKAKELNIKI